MTTAQLELLEAPDIQATKRRPARERFKAERELLHALGDLKREVEPDPITVREALSSIANGLQSLRMRLEKANGFHKGQAIKKLAEIESLARRGLAKLEKEGRHGKG